MKTNEIIQTVTRSWSCCTYSLRVFVNSSATKKEVENELNYIFGANNYEYFWGDMYLACRRPESYE